MASEDCPTKTKKRVQVSWHRMSSKKVAFGCRHCSKYCLPFTGQANRINHLMTHANNATRQAAHWNLNNSRRFGMSAIQYSIAESAGHNHTTLSCYLFLCFWPQILVKLASGCQIWQKTHGARFWKHEPNTLTFTHFYVHFLTAIHIFSWVPKLQHDCNHTYEHNSTMLNSIKSLQGA